MKILTPAEAQQRGVKVLAHSNPGCGKTRLFTALPWGDEGRWGTRAAFVPFDIKEYKMLGVLPANREHLIPAVPDDGPTHDPYTFAMQVLDRDWSSEFPGCRTIILDTLTSLARQILQAAANNPAYGNVQVAGSGQYAVRMTTENHYGIAHTLMANIVRKIAAHPLNVLALFWSDWKEPPSGAPGGLYGGPLTVNMNFSKAISGEFDVVVYLRTEGGKYYAHTQPYGFWDAKMPTDSLVNPMTRVELQPDPVHFWREFDKTTGAPSAAPAAAAVAV